MKCKICKKEIPNWNIYKNKICSTECGSKVIDKIMNKLNKDIKNNTIDFSYLK